MQIEPGNFFIMRETESHYIDHKIDGDLRWLSNRYEKNDVVAVLLFDNTIRYLPNAISRSQYYAMRGVDVSTCWSDPLVGFRYDAEKQLELVKAHPTIDLQKWRPIRVWEDELISKLPIDIARKAFPQYV